MSQNEATKSADDGEFTIEDVEFPSCGVTLRGFLLRPAGARRLRPAIVMAPGMSGVKEGSILKYASFFARSGFVVLTYDHINFGASDGEVRQEADPQLQRRGYRDAITYVRTRPEVDRDRIGVWGTSYSGGHVLEVAAHDRRVKCVVSQIALINGFEVFRRMTLPHRTAVLRRLDADRDARFRGEPPAMVKAMSEDPREACVMPGPSAFEYFSEQAKLAPNWRNALTLRSMDHSRGLLNSAYLPYISPTPLLMIVAIQDELVPSEISIAAYQTALEPKKLVLIPGDHFSPYEKDFDVTAGEARSWFEQHLAAAPAGG